MAALIIAALFFALLCVLIVLAAVRMGSYSDRRWGE